MLYDYSSYLKNSLYKDKGLTNFVNLGNSCYFNAALCSLINCLGLTDFLIKNKHLKLIGPKNRESPEFGYLLKYIQLLVFYFSKNYTLSLKSLYNDMFLFIPSLTKDQQNDAQECMIGILNLLHIATSVDMLEGPEDTKIHKHLVLANREWVNNFKNDYSIIKHLFFGQYIQKLKCSKCGNTSYKYDPFLDISLCFVNKKTPTIDDLLVHNFKRQEVEMLCEDQCKETTLFSKRTRIIKLPKYLIIHLKRFDEKSEKIQKMIGFSSDLDMSNYTSLVDKQSVNYKLISVINHQGSTDFGHYFNFNKTFEGDWVKINNNTTKKIQPVDVCTKDAYILIYELDSF